MPQRRTLLRDTGNQDAGQAALSAAAAATSAPEAVSGTGQLETVRYGAVLRARRLVGVRGSGFSYDGLYYVKSVTHQIARGSYTQSFRLSRDGTGSLLPVLPALPA
jgi:phage protein D